MGESIPVSLPELPDAKKARFIADYSLSAYDAGVLVGDQEMTTDHMTELLSEEVHVEKESWWIYALIVFAILRKSGILAS